MNSKQSRAARGLLKWSQRQLADKSSVGLSTIADFENDKREPRADNLTAMSRALEDAGVIFENDGKYVVVRMKIRRAKQ
jgi:transcriptional regulator with XRE-family HTH domain